MRRFSENYYENREYMERRLRSSESFDIIERRLEIAGQEMCFFYIDGFTKDGEMQRIMQFLLSLKECGNADSVLRRLPYVEVAISENCDEVITAVLSGQSALFSESFGGQVILVDLRTYPARTTEEPDSDRVMQGAHDGFVETLIMNTALIRRRIRDERLTIRHFNIGGISKTDVAVCYMKGLADEKTVSEVEQKISRVKPKSLTLGFQGLAESLIPRGWYNPFPKIRSTERPDAAAAHLAEGSVLVICDTSPRVMIFPTSIFDYLQQTDDFYLPPLTGTYLRIIRTLILLLSVIITPLWYLCIEYSERLPAGLLFLVPEEPGAIPIILQLFLVELAIDGLKIASMNTPDLLSNSLSVVGALLLGDFAVTIGWLSADVILYMAFVAIANFAQQNLELGYAFKFMRMLILALTFLLGFWGFIFGISLFIVFVALNKTLIGKRYLYPLIPFNARALLSLFVRRRKTAAESETEKES